MPPLNLAGRKMSPGNEGGSGKPPPASKAFGDRNLSTRPPTSTHAESEAWEKACGGSEKKQDLSNYPYPPSHSGDGIAPEAREFGIPYTGERAGGPAKIDAPRLPEETSEKRAEPPADETKRFPYNGGRDNR